MSWIVRGNKAMRRCTLHRVKDKGQERIRQRRGKAAKIDPGDGVFDGIERDIRGVRDSGWSLGFVGDICVCISA